MKFLFIAKFPLIIAKDIDETKAYIFTYDIIFDAESIHE